MPFKFERLEVWRLALEYIDLIDRIAGRLPRSEEFNLRSQIVRAATSVALNIAEGSTGQTDAEQARFLGLSTRSVLETVACQHIINRRKLISDAELMNQAYLQAETLVVKLVAMRRAIAPDQGWLRDERAEYSVLSDTEVSQATDIVA